MARSVNSDPLLSHNFALMDVPVAGALPLAFPIKTIQSAIESGSFIGARSVTVPAMQMDFKEIRELNDPHVHSVPTGYTTTGEVSIEMAVLNTNIDMYAWFLQVVHGRFAPRRSLLAAQTRNEKFLVQRLYLLKDCVPSSWTGVSQLDGTSSEVTVERLALHAHEVRLLPTPVPLV